MKRPNAFYLLGLVILCSCRDGKIETTGAVTVNRQPSQPSAKSSLVEADGDSAPTGLARDGELGPLIPMHKDAIASGLIWHDPARAPRILFWMRPSEYRGTDLVDASVGAVGRLRPEFQRSVYGTFAFSALLDGSNLSRIKSDIGRENTLILDLGDPTALANSGKYRPEELTEADFALNASAFRDAGSSQGLDYNIFCAGQSPLADGRWAVLGGHDKAGNLGIRKVNVFDPVTETWADRGMPAVKRDFLADPSGSAFPHASPQDELNTDPAHPSDLRYQRWYPTSVTLPDGRVLVLSGTDEDSAAAANAALTKVRIATPEVWDPVSERTTALESARKLQPMYVRSFVVETGEGRNDWRVATVAEAKAPLPTGEQLRAFDPWKYTAKTSYLDVLGALSDPSRDVAGSRHWEDVGSAAFSHVNGASVALWELDERGHARQQKVVLFGGDAEDGAPVDAIEAIDFSSPMPTWQLASGKLAHPATENLAVALPDGTAIVMGGRARVAGAAPIITYDVQHYDPKTGRIRTVATTTIPRHDHSTALLLPDGSVMAMGGNRADIVPTAADLGVPVAQIYKPWYFFAKDERPEITDAPRTIRYGRRFRVEVAGEDVESAVLVSMAPTTHNWSWDNRYLKLSVLESEDGELVVRAPASGAVAVPGYYMLFVLDADGVPSESVPVRLRGSKGSLARQR